MRIPFQACFLLECTTEDEDVKCSSGERGFISDDVTTIAVYSFYFDFRYPPFDIAVKARSELIRSLGETGFSFVMKLSLYCNFSIIDIGATDNLDLLQWTGLSELKLGIRSTSFGER
jgi:hypothetical protein